MKKSIPPIIVKVLLLLAAVGLVLLFSSFSTQPVSAFGSLSAKAEESSPTPIPGQANPHIGGDCLDCHGNPALIGQALNGETISLYVEPSEHQGSFHSREGGGCTKFCHERQTAYPHESSTIESCAGCHWETTGITPTDGQLIFKLPYQDVRAVALEVNQSCQKCHVEIFETTTDSAHTRIMQEGNRFAPVCSDCHSGHDISLVSRADISAVCKKCHLAEYSTYKGSVHGSALEAESNLDVPTCANCHGSHLVSGPGTESFREKSVQICGECHSKHEIMDKYNISTNVLSTYMDDVHGLTDWYRKTNLENITRATCYDCHGKHNILSPENPASRVYPENLQSTCQQCHEDANIRFPQTWLSHQRVNLKENAGLSLVNTLAWIVVLASAVVIVFMITLDIRKKISLRKNARKLVEEKAEVKEESHD